MEEHAVTWGGKKGTGSLFRLPLEHGGAMKATRGDDKLSEARFFLKHLRGERESQQQTHAGHLKKVARSSNVFRYYVSAYLSAAVSVIYFLEAKDKAWVRKWRLKLPEPQREFFNRMQSQRNSEVHELNPKISVENKAVPIEFVPSVQVLPYDILRYDTVEIESGLVRVWVQAPQSYFELTGEPAEVSQACTQHFALVERLFRKFAEAHQPRSSPGARGAKGDANLFPDRRKGVR